MADTSRGRGRLRRREWRRRMAEFARLMAVNPWLVFQNARYAGLSYAEAERLLADQDFQQLVEGLVDDDSPVAKAA